MRFSYHGPPGSSRSQHGEGRPFSAGGFRLRAGQSLSLKGRRKEERPGIMPGQNGCELVVTGWHRGDCGDDGQRQERQPHRVIAARRLTGQVIGHHGQLRCRGREPLVAAGLARQVGEQVPSRWAGPAAPAGQATSSSISTCSAIRRYPGRSSRSMVGTFSAPPSSVQGITHLGAEWCWVSGRTGPAGRLLRVPRAEQAAGVGPWTVPRSR